MYGIAWMKIAQNKKVSTFNEQAAYDDDENCLNRRFQIETQREIRNLEHFRYVGMIPTSQPSRIKIFRLTRSSSDYATPKQQRSSFEATSLMEARNVITIDQSMGSLNMAVSLFVSIGHNNECRVNLRTPIVDPARPRGA